MDAIRTPGRSPFVNSTPAASRAPCIRALPFRGKPRGLARGNPDDVRFVRARCRYRRPAAFHDGSPHLGCRYRLVLLADDNVDQVPMVKRKGADIAFAPVDVQCHRPRNGEHFGTEITPATSLALSIGPLETPATIPALKYKGADPLAAGSPIKESNRPMAGSAALRSTALVWPPGSK